MFGAAFRGWYQQLSSAKSGSAGKLSSWEPDLKVDCKSRGKAEVKHLSGRLLPAQELHSLFPVSCNALEWLQVMGLLNNPY